jgi:hypothetical protein
MRLRVDRTVFVAEARRFALRFCCEHCAHFMGPAEHCAHGWPAADHREARYAEHEDFDEVVFCKEFELK